MINPEYLWQGMKAAPDYMQIRLGDVRVMENLSDKLMEFLTKITDIPDDAILVINGGEFSVLVDDDGNLLAFR